MNTFTTTKRRVNSNKIANSKLINKNVWENIPIFLTLKQYVNSDYVPNDILHNVIKIVYIDEQDD